MWIAALVFVIAGEPLRFDAAARPQFTAAQMAHTAAATRDGMTRWAATAQGHALVEWFAENDCEIQVIEDKGEQGIGRAPQPGLATLIATHQHTRRTFQLILNPQFFKLPKDMTPLPDEPATPADVMAAAWAGEILHIWFYARGISLPHHQRPDFQREWHLVARQLRIPNLTHDDFDAQATPWRGRSLAAFR
jgi:hypothetical protein